MSLASKWKQNPLFRLLAFLDNTGLQEFTVGQVDTEGVFLDPPSVVGEDTTCGAILRHAIHVLRENIEAFVEEEEEKTALLKLTEPDSEWEKGVRLPPSLVAFVGVFPSTFPAALLTRLETLFQVDRDNSLSVSPITEQFLIDGLDAFTHSLPREEVDRMALACGVEPKIWESTRNLSVNQSDIISSFFADIVYPTKDMMEQQGNVTVVDWLVESYEKNRETVDVSDGPGSDSEGEGDVAHRAQAHKRAREDEEQRDLAGLADLTAEEEGEVVLTAANLDRMMLENPSVIPRSIIREKRKGWADSSITQEELDLHYTAGELRKVVKEMASLTCTPHPLSEELLNRTKRATRKAEFIDIIMDMHKEQAENTRQHQKA
ncbi:hypothetical protein, conserved [Angomonas deanei]|uniref:Uncharacterized protein n=1 Tax=Angomonas deanei TaxID=59799 RepID=A0A7G2CFL9_9TRYP|nr:hypothetical protein, conserved [Angomonas deanei]